MSIDTTEPAVAEHGARQGAKIINSVSLAAARPLAEVARDHGCDLVLMHAREMAAMTGFSEYPDEAYGDIVDDVCQEWSRAAAEATAVGLPRERLIFDPGLGFTKNARQSLTLSKRLGEVKARLGVRILLGPSRKSYLGHAVARAIGGEPPPPRDRLGASIAAALDGAARGADMLRVHDVREVRQALAFAASLGATDPIAEMPTAGEAGRV